MAKKPAAPSTQSPKPARAAAPAGTPNRTPIAAGTAQMIGAAAVATGAPESEQDADEFRDVTFSPDVVGSTGLKQYGGFVVEEFVKELKGLRGMATYREMADNDPVIGAILFAINALLQQTVFKFQAADESDKGEAGKQFAEEIFDDMSCTWQEALGEILTMFPYGFAPMEIIWKKRVGPDETDGSLKSKYTDGKIGVRALSLRAQTTLVRWVFDEDTGEPIAMVQQPIAGPMVQIPIAKMALFRTRAERNNPEGRSILRNAYRPWYFKKRIEEIEAIGVERELAGMPLVRIPSQYLDANADTQQKAIAAAYKRLLVNIRRDRQDGILLPSDRDQSGNLKYDFELVNSGGTRQIDTTKIVDRYDNRITASVLADFIMLGQHGSSGSRAMSTNKSDIFMTAITAYLDMICEVYNQQVISKVWKLNGMPEETMPKLTHGDIERKDLAGLAALLTALAGAGATLFPDADLENHIREEAGLPPAAEDGEGWGTQPPMDQPGGTPPGGMQPNGVPVTGAPGKGAAAGGSQNPQKVPAGAPAGAKPAANTKGGAGKGKGAGAAKTIAADAKIAQGE